MAFAVGPCTVFCCVDKRIYFLVFVYDPLGDKTFTHSCGEMT